MKIKNRTYPAKLLLFGEYTVGQGGSALAVPYHRYGARWAADKTNYELLAGFYSFLKKRKFDFLQMDLLEKLIETQRGLHCDIPIGYGLGSSGAITAAVYDHICVSGKEKTPESVREELALMENYYHGASSGTDPLVAYLNRPVRINAGNGNIEIFNRDVLKENKSSLYLYDSKQPRLSQAYINYFSNQSKKRDFIENYLEPINLIVEDIIEIILENKPGVYELFQKISALQYACMEPMIVDTVLPFWEKGLESGDYAFKLCGAGGGGMYYVMGERGAMKEFDENLIEL